MRVIVTHGSGDPRLAMKSLMDSPPPTLTRAELLGDGGVITRRPHR
jgi:hypothetical protein